MSSRQQVADHASAQEWHLVEVPQVLIGLSHIQVGVKSMAPRSGSQTSMQAYYDDAQFTGVWQDADHRSEGVWSQLFQSNSWTTGVCWRIVL